LQFVVVFLSRTEQATDRFEGGFQNFDESVVAF